MNHTKEPWEVIAVDDMYEIHSKTTSYEVVWSIDQEANARRIVACVNGCLDIPDEDIDKFFKWARKMWFRQERLLKEEREKLAKMTDKEKAEYEARRESTLDYNLRSLRRDANVKKIRQ